MVRSRPRLPRHLIAASVLTAGAVACSGSAALVATATAAPPATTRDTLPADPLTPVTAVLALVAQLTNAGGALIHGLASFQLDGLLASLTDGQLGEVLTRLTGVELAEVLDGTLLGRALSALTTVATPQLVPLLLTLADTLRDGVPEPVGYLLESLLDIGAGVLGARGEALPAQITSFLTRPGALPSSDAPAATPRTLRVRIRSTAAARDRRSVRARLSCPAASGTACPVVVRATIAGHSASSARRTTIAPGRTATLRVPLRSAARKRLAARGGTVRLAVATAGAAGRAASTAVRVPAPR